MVLIRRTGRPRLTLLLVVLLSVTVVAIDSQAEGTGVVSSVRDGAADAVSSLRSAVTDVLEPVGDAFSGVTGYGSLEDENDELRARVSELEGSALRAEDAEEEMAELLRLLDLDYLGDIDTVAARVVSAPVSNFEQTIELSKGSGDGLSEGMPVVDGTGLVGRLVSVSSSRSTVRLLTDPAISVGVRLSGSGELALAEGDGSGRPLTVGLVERGARVRRGDVAFTSGLDGAVYPADVPVGRVVGSRPDSAQLQQSVELEPVADLENLRLVSVLQWRPDPTP